MGNGNVVTPESKDRLDNLWKVYLEVARQIDFADRKAAFILTFQNIHWGVIFFKVFENNNSHVINDIYPVSKWLFVVSIISSFISLLCAIYVVYPRYRKRSAAISNNDSVLWAQEIASYQAVAYQERFNLKLMESSLCTSITLTSSILNKKYLWNRHSIELCCVSFVSTMIGIIVLLFS